MEKNRGVRGVCVSSHVKGFCFVVVFLSVFFFLPPSALDYFCVTFSLQHDAYDSSEIQAGTASSPSAPQCPDPVTVPHSIQFSS